MGLKAVLVCAIGAATIFQFVLFNKHHVENKNDNIAVVPNNSDPGNNNSVNSNYSNSRRLGSTTASDENEQQRQQQCSVEKLIAKSSKEVQQPEKSILSNLRGKLFGSPPPTKKPCALLFFGLAKQFRSLILPSIEQYILSIPANEQCDIFAHTYDVTEVVGKSHKNETGIIINPKEIYDLTSNVVMDTEEEFQSARRFKKLMNGIYKPTRRMGWSTESLGNMYRQWHSIERVWDYMTEFEGKQNIQYERVGMFRSDVLYQTPINIFEGGDAVIPKFGFLVNDRMFYGTRRNAHIWSKIRFSGMLTPGCYKRRHPSIGMHSEFYMKDFILQKMSTSTNTQVYEDLNICFFRVRSNGDVETDDCTKVYEMPSFLIDLGLV